jgi:hypothetical protein
VEEDTTQMEECSGYSRQLLVRDSEEEKSVGELQKETNIMEGGMKWDEM